MAAIAFERAEKGGFLTADIGTRTSVGMDVHIEAGPEDVLAQNPGITGLGQRDVHDVDEVVVLAAEVYVARAGFQSPSGNDHPFDQRMRVVFEKVSVLERARLGLVRI